MAVVPTVGSDSETKTETETNVKSSCELCQLANKHHQAAPPADRPVRGKKRARSLMLTPGNPVGGVAKAPNWAGVPLPMGKDRN